jgi:hypothetical protein
MRHVRAKPGQQALERLILVAEEDEFRARAMGVDIGLVERGILEARIVEDQQVLREGGDGEDGGDRRAEGQVTNHDGEFPCWWCFLTAGEIMIRPLLSQAHSVRIGGECAGRGISPGGRLPRARPDLPHAPPARSGRA